MIASKWYEKLKANSIVYDLRLKHGMSQEKFAKKLGITQSYLSKIETGQKPVTLEIFQTLVANKMISASDAADIIFKKED